MAKNRDYIRGLQTRRDEFKRELADLLQALKEGNKRIQKLNTAIYGIDQLLALEGISPEPSSEAGDGDGIPGELTLANILKSILADRRYHSVDDLVEAVKQNGYEFGPKSPLRAVGFTLLGLGRGGKYQRNNDGKWRFVG